MVGFINTHSNKLRFFAAGLLVVVSLLILPFLLNLIWINPTVQAASTDSNNSSGAETQNDSPNVVTAGMSNAADKISQISNSAEQAIINSSHAAAKSISVASIDSGKFVAHGVTRGAGAIANAT